MSDDLASDERASGVPELSGNVLETYARLWQFKTWLRRLVLRSTARAGWRCLGKAKLAEKNDKDLPHSPRPRTMY